MTSLKELLRHWYYCPCYVTISVSVFYCDVTEWYYAITKTALWCQCESCHWLWHHNNNSTILWRHITLLLCLSLLWHNRIKCHVLWRHRNDKCTSVASQDGLWHHKPDWSFTYFPDTCGRYYCHFCCSITSSSVTTFCLVVCCITTNYNTLTQHAHITIYIMALRYHTLQ